MPRKTAPPPFDALSALRECAFELFGRYGHDGVSIGDIAGAAGLSKGALYWHYRGKEALYLECLQRLHTLFDQYIFAPMRAQNDPVRAVLQLFAGLHRLQQDPLVGKGIAGYWLIPKNPQSSALTQAQTRFEADSRAVIEQTLARGAAAGAFDLHDDLEEFSRAVICLVEAVVLPLRRQSADEVGRMLAVLARTLFRAYARDPATARTLVGNIADTASIHTRPLERQSAPD
ncbi:MAG: TetR/AcrR family transcriptional regulator [Gammaproteobacteria bacterium]|nr:TetR/AcrR family transcriptional regulator [Gammaproteobacteria bacterium]